jgi:polyketide synthase PksN
LFVWGIDIDWTQIYAATTRRRVLLPTYPFERQRYWLDTLPINRGADGVPSRSCEILDTSSGDVLDPAELVQNRLAPDGPRPTSVDTELVACLIEMLASALEADAATIDPRRPVVELGVDSFLAVDMARRLANRLQRAISPTILYEAGSIAALATRLIAEDLDSVTRLANATRKPVDPVDSTQHSGSPVSTELNQPARPGGIVSEARALQTTAVIKPAIGRCAGVEPIAIIGVGVRVPGASDLHELWSLIRAGRDMVAPVSPERWRSLAACENEIRESATAGNHSAALLSGLEWFDPQFFRLSPREAEEMDPQQRVLLETSWEALESAGYAGGLLSGTSTGVFVGGMGSEYLARLLAMPDQLGAYAVTGNTLSILANRLSYLLNLNGPCLALDTACSSSLVALHLAIESLRRGECDKALVAGAQVGLAPSHFHLMRRFGGLSPRGRCRPFAQGADGYALGEGVGVVLLKPLERALSDRDHVLAVIRAAAVNHGGQAAGLTVPNPAAQAKVIRAALHEAQLLAEDITLMEAHGTGTALGDPIEVQGLSKALRDDTRRSQFCALGSLKANIGHLEPAAGILGLIKLVAALRARELPPTLHVNEPNRSISFADSPFYVADRARPWNSPAGVPRRAGVSSFGYGGTNAHVIVEEAATSSAVPSQQNATVVPPHVLVLSARSQSALKSLAARFAEQLASSTQSWLDICWAASTGRPHWSHRLAIVAYDAQSAARQLDEHVRQAESTAISELANHEEESRRLRLNNSLAALSGDARSLFDQLCAFPGQSTTGNPSPENTKLAVSELLKNASDWKALCEALAESYSLGGEIDWHSLLVHQSPRRVPLPTYPFERQRLWRDLHPADADAAKNNEVSAPTRSAQADESRAVLAQWLHVANWRATPRGEAHALARGVWIIFDDESTFGDELIARLLSGGARVIRVQPRKTPVRHEIDWHTPSEARIQIAPDVRESYVKLFEAVTIAGLDRPAGIVHLWSRHKSITSTAQSVALSTAELCKSTGWQLSVISSLRLLQALSTAMVRPTTGTWFVTQGAQPVGSNDLANPVAAALWGAVRAAERERSDLLLRLRDLPADCASHDAQFLIDDLHEVAPAFQRAWREDTRYAPGLEPWVSTADCDVKPSWPVAADGAYLISGGLGAIGLAVAESLVEQGARRLALISRRGLLTQQLDDRAIAVVERLRALGASVWTPKVDVCDGIEIDQLIAKIRNELGPLSGVVHAAGILADRLLPNVEPRDFERVLAPKLSGAANLLAATSGRPLNFFVVLSSLAGHLGNAGQIAYSAASAYLDGWVIAARRQHTTANLSLVDLGPWGEAGMALQAATNGRGRSGAAIDSKHSRCDDGLLNQMQQFWRERGMELIPPRIGCQAIAVAARQGLRQLVVAKETMSDASAVSRTSSTDLRPLSEIARATSRMQPPSRVADDTGKTIGSRDITTLSHRLSSHIAQVAAEVLRLPASQVDHEKEFREHGLDSLMADEVVRRLRKTLQLPELRVGELFARPTVASLADWLSERFTDHLDKVLAAAEGDPKLPAIDQESIVARPSSLVSARAVSSRQSDRDVAVIGYACRFPGAANAAAFGRLLRDKRSAVGPMPTDRWQAACEFDPHYYAAFDHEPPVGAFLTDIDRFDPEFFRIAPSEAAQIDPRQRMFLEIAYHAAEHAGYGGSALRGAKCGVFVGTGGEDYYAGVAGKLFGEHAAPGGTAAALPGRLAYFLDLHGPALAIDTACSSSLVALHHAVESVRRAECDYAFVGGVHLHVRLYSYLSLLRMGALSPRGACRPFDRRADGFVPGEGVAALLIRPLADALAAGDTVFGVIRGSAVNNDGRSNGLLAPNPLAQTQLLQTAWADAAIDPASISYLEAHGTGTLLGDPVEWGAIDEALRSATHRRQFISIGGVKSNIGHADAAAGLAGVIKVLLSFEQCELLPTRGFVEPNPRFDLENSPLVLADRVRPWRPEAPDGSPMPCRAGVSSFGFAGTNAHVVLEEPPLANDLVEETAVHVLTLSAFDESGLRRLATDYAARLRENSHLRWIDVCFTANTGRAHLRERLAVVAATCREGIEALQLFADGGNQTVSDTNVVDHARPSLLHMRSGDEAARADWHRAFRDQVAELRSPDLQRLRAASTGHLAAELLITAGVEQVSQALTANDVRPDASVPTRHGEKPLLLAAAEIYALGATVDWSRIEDYSDARRVALPLYPYRDERYWLALPKVETLAASLNSNSVEPASELGNVQIDDLLAVPVWKPSNFARSARQVVSGRWLIVGERSALATNLARQLRVADCAVETVTPELYATNSVVTTRSASNENIVEHYRRALAEKLNASDRWTDIVYCAVPEQMASDENAYDTTRGLSFPSGDLAGLLELIHGLQNSASQRATNLWVLTAGAQAVKDGLDCVHPENAALWGMARVIPRECPQLRLRTIDVDAHEAEQQAGEISLALIAEFARRTTAVEVAYRDHTRYVLTRQPLSGPPNSAAASIRQRGVYLITGGLGGIGLAVARWLAERYQACLVLLSRTELPPRDRWAATIADRRTAAQLRTKLEALVATEAAGGEVAIVAGDVADPATLRRAEQTARERFGVVNGVFHAAGTVRKCLLRDSTAVDVVDVLRPKVDGAKNLIEWSRRANFDFVVFFSSVAGLDGNVFQADYSAANRALDALAAAARAKGLPIQSVAWDLWHGIGMGRGMAELADARVRAALEPAVALAALERALYWGRAEMSVRATHGKAETHSSVLDNAQLVRPTQTPRPEADSNDLRIRVRRALRESVAMTLGLPVERVDAEQSLPDLGLDSLLAVKLMRGLSQATGNQLSATLPFDFASIALLADHLTSTLPGQSLENWLKLGLSASPRTNTSNSPVVGNGDVLELQSGRRVKILSRRGPAWPG